jgi:hypothetical protein
VRAVLRVYLQRILPLIMRISTRNEPARFDEVLLGHDRPVRAAERFSGLAGGGFIGVERRVMMGFMSEYVAQSPIARIKGPLPVCALG